MFAHASILAALAIAPGYIQELGGGDGQNAGAGGHSIALIDSMESGSRETPTLEVVSIAPREIVAATEPATESVTEKDVVVASKQPVKQEPPKPRELPQKTAAAAPVTPVAPPQPVVTESQDDAVATLAETVQQQEDVSATDETAVDTAATTEAEPEAEQELQPQMATKPEADFESAQAEKMAESLPEASNAVPAEEIAAPVAATAVAAKGSSSDATEAAQAGIGGTQSGQGGNSDTAGGTAGAPIGPVRDASDLRAIQGNPNPVYPARDRLDRREGTAVILGRVTADGRISELVLEQSSGSREMDNASLQAFSKWRFERGQQGWIRKPFQFRLVGDATEIPSPLGKTLSR
jgi:protein TonB